MKKIYYSRVRKNRRKLYRVIIEQIDPRLTEYKKKELYELWDAPKIPRRSIGCEYQHCSRRECGRHVFDQSAVTFLRAREASSEFHSDRMRTSGTFAWDRDERSSPWKIIKAKRHASRSRIASGIPREQGFFKIFLFSRIAPRDS